MLYSQVYNTVFTDDLKDAYRNNDVVYVTAEIKKLAAQIAERDDCDAYNCKHDPLMSRLQFCLAIVDSALRHAQTTQMLCDIINF